MKRGVPVTIEFGRFKVVRHRRELLADGRPVELGARAFDTLLALINARGTVLGKDELMGRVWPDHFRIENAFSDLHASYGGGVRVGIGPSFIVATDVGHSSESTASVYIGLGWMY